jgi:hypothetical protein
MRAMVRVGRRLAVVTVGGASAACGLAFAWRLWDSGADLTPLHGAALALLILPAVAIAGMLAQRD